ncbi:transporter associated domain-containing protein, partial [Halorubrum pallidum]
ATEGVTRLPVYGKNRGDVVGVVDVRDAIRATETGDDLASALREPTFVPETQSIDELFERMRTDGFRLAVVVDEFGAVVGLVTLEDVIEEVVGELVGRWEHDHVDVVAPDAAVVRGWTTVGHLNEALGLSLPSDGVETVAGLITQRLGRLPEEGDRGAVEDVTLNLTGATATRVTRVRVEHSGGLESDESGEDERGTNGHGGDDDQFDDE